MGREHKDGWAMMAEPTQSAKQECDTSQPECPLAPIAADDGGFLLANAISFGGLVSKNSADMDFDMEWACYTLPDDEQVEAEGSIRDVPHGTSLAAAHRTTCGGNTGMAGIQQGTARGAKRKAEDTAEAGGAEESKKAKGKAVWRKYGQKTLKGKDYTGMKMLRCYYRCNHPGCQVKKQVETCAWSNEAANITIHGIHNHPIESQPEEKNGVKKESNGANDHSIQTVPEPKPTPPLDQTFADLIVRANPHFVVADPHKEDCPIIFASAGFSKLTGYGREETIGVNCRFLQGKDTNRHAVCQLTKAIKANREIHIILLNYKKDRTPFWNLLHLSPVIGEDGTLHSIVGAQLDVSGFVNNQERQHQMLNQQWYPSAKERLKESG